YIVGSDGTLIVHSTDTKKNISGEEFFNKMNRNKTDGILSMEYEWEGQKKIQYYQYYEPIDAFVAAGFSVTEMSKILNRVRLTILIVVILANFTILLVIRLVVQSVVRPLRKGIDFAVKVAEGDLTATIDIHQKDEVGELASALRSMIEKIKNIIENIKSGA
ncbi:MAG TPA: hypothetical protein DG754_04700, partial [Bacteroidales bacterium]|nr:hypothetical protein [Bacteroidales bacterium]